MKSTILLVLFISFQAFGQNLDSIPKNKIPLKIKELDSLLKISPNLKFLSQRGYLKYRIGDYDNAMLDYNNAIATDSKNFILYYNRAILKNALKDYQGALIDYDNSIILNPLYYQSYYNRAYLKSELGDIDGAIADYSKTIEIDSENKFAYHNRGRLKRKQKLYKEAIVDLDKSIEIDSTYVPSIHDRAIAKASIGNKSALDDFNKVILLDASNGEAFANRALFFIHNKLEGNYCIDLEKAISLGFTSAEKILLKYCK